MSVLRLDAKPPPAMATRREEPMATSDEAGEADWATIITATNEEEDTSAEQLQLIKARTMWNMVEEIPHGVGQPRKLLFLTNKQAQLIGNSPASIEKMLDALEIPKPKLVINLLMSLGFSEFASSFAGWSHGNHHGVAFGRGAFESKQSEREAVEKIESFMLDILIPLAAQTNAIIICTALPQFCILTRSLTRMISVTRAKWQGEMPFTVISFADQVPILYSNGNSSAQWREVRRHSKAWLARDRLALEIQHAYNKVPLSEPLPQNSFDLDENAMCYIICDGIDEQKRKCDPSAANGLKVEILRHLARTLPSITLKTGTSAKMHVDTFRVHQASIGCAAEMLLGGSPTVFLDVRERKHPALAKSESREELIAAAKIAICDISESLNKVAPDVFDSLDVCCISYLHDVLFGDGNVETTELNFKRGKSLDGRRRVPLCEAIDTLQSGHAETTASGLQPATPQQVSSICDWYSNEFFSWQFKQLKHQQQNGVVQTHVDYFQQKIECFSIQTRSLLLSENFHHLHLGNLEGAKSVVDELVKLDRLPKNNSLEAMLMLRRAWCRHDICIHLAEQYKFIGKLLFVLELLVSWTIVFIATAKTDIMMHAKDGKNVIFGLSLVASLLLTIDSLIEAKDRWWHLRGGAGALESMIWRFRARVREFATDAGEGNSSASVIRCETVLSESMNAWLDELVGGANLQSTALLKNYPDTVFVHHQHEVSSNPPIPLVEDDFHSPVKPDEYIKLRLDKHVDFWQSRLPVYVRRRTILKSLLLTCAGFGSVLAYLDYSNWVVIVTAAAGSITSWVEFSDLSRKIERYTAAIGNVEKLVTWWEMLSPVEKAGVDNTNRLIESGETIIRQEQAAWASVAARQSKSIVHSDTTRIGDIEQGASERENQKSTMKSHKVVTKVHPA